MSPEATERFRVSWKTALLIAIILAGCAFMLQGFQGFNVADEGFLWYGVQRTTAGGVPLRDFQSYEPGRYYLCAAVAAVFGNGLVVLRVSQSLAQALGLWAGLLAGRRIASDWRQLLGLGIMLALWMVPSHKLFDHALLLAALLVVVRLIEEPSKRRVFAAGCLVGLCTFFGRNHALYDLIATGGLLLLLHWKAPREVPVSRIEFWLLGIGLGLVPILVMLAFVPGFFLAYRESIESIFRNGTNLRLPIPWPWRASGVGGAWTLSRLLLGLLFLALPIFYLATVAASARMSAKKIKENALLVGCGFLGVVYMHHAFARADFSHLAQAIHPFTLGVCAIVSPAAAFARSYRWATITLLGVIALLGGARENPLYQRLTARVPWVLYNDTVYLPAKDAQDYKCLRQFVDSHLDARETLLIAPYTPGLYALLDRPSPLWETFFFFPATDGRQEAAIRRLTAERVNWALIGDSTIDHREDLRFSATHKLLARYLEENFAPVSLPCLPKSMKMLHRRGDGAIPESGVK